MLLSLYSLHVDADGSDDDILMLEAVSARYFHYIRAAAACMHTHA